MKWVVIEYIYSPNGIPQGTNLAPLFIMIYLKVVKDANIWYYVDDIKISYEIWIINDAQRLGNVLTNITQCSEKNSMKTNIGKIVKKSRNN